MRRKKPRRDVARTAVWWLMAEGMAPKTGERVAWDNGEETAARVRRPIGRARSSTHVLRGSAFGGGDSGLVVPGADTGTGADLGFSLDCLLLPCLGGMFVDSTSIWC